MMTAEEVKRALLDPEIVRLFYDAATRVAELTKAATDQYGPEIKTVNKANRRAEARRRSAEDLRKKRKELFKKRGR